MEKEKWKKRPTSIINVPNDITHVVFMDENGDCDLAYILDCIKKDNKPDENSIYFSVTSALCQVDELESITTDFINIKNKHWPPDGCYNYDNKIQKVCFHSREIRRMLGPFSKNTINTNDFINDLNKLMNRLPITLTTCFINKEKLCSNYGKMAKDPYELAVTYILERIVQRQLKHTDKIIVILESRGKKEDKLVLDTLLNLINHGTYYVKKSFFQKIIGIYFNPKRPKSDDKKSFFGLEIADLCAYPIFKYCKLNKKDKAFELIEHKIYNYPNYNGRGLKKFP